MTSRVLMCEPAYYRIAYEINPWMRRANAVTGHVAEVQWAALRDALIELGVEVQLVEPFEDVPDMTFTANAGIVVGRTFVPANFRFPERQPEAAHFVAWFERQGYRIASIHEPHYWEGEGDVLVADGRIYAGYRFRTEYRALDHIDAIMGAESRRLELVDPHFYHLDTCFCPLGEGRAMYYPPAFSAESQRMIAKDFETLFAVPDAEASRFACNAVVANGTVVLNTGCEATERELERLGFACRPTPTDEFIKAGGSVKCLVLTLDTFETVAAGIQEL